MKNNHHRNHQAFTLIELLVVLAILSLLLSMLIPSVSKGIDLARRVVCLSNTRQMVTAANVYAAQHDNCYPLAISNPLAGSKFKSIAWDFKQLTDGTIESGLLWPERTSTKIQQCPSFKGSANWSGDKYTGYNYNTSYIGRTPWSTIQTPVRITDIENPNDCAIFGDGEYAGGANKFMRSPIPAPSDSNFFDRHSGTQGFRHLGTTNVAVCDGSARYFPERHTKMFPAFNEPNIAEGTGFLSDDNSLYDLE